MNQVEIINGIGKLIDGASKIVIIQADNPDGDSLASALALEQILGDLDKEVVLYCGVDVPRYLRYMSGWDRVTSELPTNFDASIIVDTSSLMLLETLQKSDKISWVSSKPCIVIDHHVSPSTVYFASSYLIRQAVSTTELIYVLAEALGYDVNEDAANLLSIGILSDSLGLTSESVTVDAVKILADLIEKGANLAQIDNQRKQLQKKSIEILKYKGQLLDRVELSESGKTAFLIIPWDEIEKYSHQYNPAMLAIDEMRQVLGVDVAVVFKTYPDGRITGKIRANYGIRVAAMVAEQFGGGGHEYASGFRVTDGRKINDIKIAVVNAIEAQLNDEAV